MAVKRCPSRDTPQSHRARYQRARRCGVPLALASRMLRTIRRAAASGEKRPPVLRVGCSGWQYRHWRGEFYPDAVPASRWLEYYASHFDTVEINNSFYRLPTAATFATWRERVPPGFVYAVKASRYITHLKKLQDPVDPLERLFSRAVKLRRTLGPVLYQLPPSWPLNLGRLRKFLAALPKRRRHAVEFRDPSWYVEEVFESLPRTSRRTVPARHGRLVDRAEDGWTICLRPIPWAVEVSRRLR